MRENQEICREQNLTLFVCALYAEAKPIIEALKLKKQNSPFELFGNENYALIISGMGKTNAIIATTHLVTLYKNSAFIVNVGIAGAKSLAIGSAVVANKIIDAYTKEEFFPDILVVHPFLEGSLTTLDAPCDEPSLIDTELVDMEASGFFEAASKFFSPHQILILKVVSDNLNIEVPKKELVSSLIQKHTKEILEYLENLEKLFKSHTFDTARIEFEAFSVIGLSFTQKHQLKDRLIYEALQNR